MSAWLTSVLTGLIAKRDAGDPFPSASYDAWKTNAPDPGSTRSGRAPVDHLHCECCSFRGPVLAAIEHYRQTTHPLTFRGVRQDLQRILDEQAQTARQCPAERRR